MRALVTLVLAAATLALAPSAASALSCPSGPGALGELHASHAAFIGQAVARDGNHVTMTVLEAFKGPAAGETVEVIYADGFPMTPPGADTTLVNPQPTIVFADDLEGRLFTTVCRSPGVTPDALRAAGAAEREGLRCPAPPRIAWVARALRGRTLSLRLAIAEGQGRASVVRVHWGQVAGAGLSSPTTRRVRGSRAVLMRHRYRQGGDVRVSVTVRSGADLPASLCAEGFSFLSLQARVP